MKELKREIKLYMCTTFILWAMKFIPDDCTALKLWFLQFPHKSINHDRPGNKRIKTQGS